MTTIKAKLQTNYCKNRRKNINTFCSFGVLSAFKVKSSLAVKAVEKAASSIRALATKTSADHVKL